MLHYYVKAAAEQFVSLLAGRERSKKWKCTVKLNIPNVKATRIGVWLKDREREQERRLEMQG